MNKKINEKINEIQITKLKTPEKTTEHLVACVSIKNKKNSVKLKKQSPKGLKINIHK